MIFDSAALRLHASSPGATYRVQWLALDKGTGIRHAAGDEIALTNPRVSFPSFAWGSPDRDGVRYAVTSITTIDASHPKWVNPVVVTVRDRNGAIDIVGIKRLSQAANVS